MVSEEEIKIVLERLATMPSNLKLSLGSQGQYSRKQLIEEVEKRSKTGELIVNVYMQYLRSFKEAVK